MAPKEGRSEVGPPFAAEAFVQAVQPLLPTMKALAIRLVGGTAADDMVQDAVELAWRQWDRYDASRGSLRAWLLMLVTDRVRRQVRQRRLTFTPLDGVDLAAGPSSSDLDLQAALRTLTLRQRTAVALFYYLDLPVTQVAEVMDCSVGTAKSTLSDARRRLAGLLGAEFPGGGDDI